MIQLEEAYEIVMNSAFLTGTEKIWFTGSLNRILAEDIASDMDLPSFDKSTVDGYACRRTDLMMDLELKGIIPAGEVPASGISHGQCMKIMTGAQLPNGADCVFMVEDSEVLQSGKIRCTVVREKNNISVKGEDARKDQIVLAGGKIIQPPDIAVMATVGHTSLTVMKKPVVAIISSGSELVEPDFKPAQSQIRNSNAYQLMVQVIRAGGEYKYYGIAPDDEAKTMDAVEKAVSECDIVLITGGVSMGDFDFIPGVLENAGVKLLFTKIAVQPGKPTVFGKHPDCLVFGLPGNPVSSFIQFEMLVRPLISAMMGYRWHPVEPFFPMKDGYSRKTSDRLALIPVNISADGYVIPVEYHGSGHIAALSNATGIIRMPAGINSVSKGELVRVRQI